MALGNVTATITTPPRWQAGQEYTAVGYYTVGAAVAQNDTITFTNIIPAGGVEIISVRLVTPKLDTNASPTGVWIVGDSGDDNRFIDAVSMGWTGAQTAVTYESNVTPSSTTGIGYQYTGTSATSLIAKINAAVATAASSGQVSLFVRYYCRGQ